MRLSSDVGGEIALSEVDGRAKGKAYSLQLKSSVYVKPCSSSVIFAD